MPRDSNRTNAPGRGSAVQPVSTDGDGTRDDLSAKHTQDAEAQYRSVFEATNDGLMIADMDGYIVEANPAYCRMFGYSREEVVGLRAAAFAAPESRQAVDVSVQALKASDEHRTLAKALRKDGSTFFAEARATRFTYRGGSHYLAVVQDVTERVRAYELLEERVDARTHELSTLLDISHNVTSTLEVRPLLDLILEQLRTVAEYHGAGIVLLEGDQLRVIGYRGPIPQTIALQTTFPANTLPVWEYLTRGDPVIIPDVRGDDLLARAYQRAAGERLETLYAYVRCFLAVPMTLKDQVIGALTLEHSHPGYYSDRHLALAMAVAQQAAIAIENARLYEQTVQRTSELSALLDVSHNVASTLELRPLLGLILDQLNLVADNDGITLLEVRGDEFVVLLRRAPGQEDQEFPTSYSAQSHGPIWDTLRRGEVVIIGDVHGDDPLAHAYRKTVGDFLNSSLSFEKSFMAVPLMLKDRIIGLLGLSSTRSDYYTPHHGEVALAIAQQAAIAMENARLYERSEQRTRELATLLDISHDVASTLELERLLELILEQLQSVVDYVGAGIVVQEEDEVRIVRQRGPESYIIPSETRIPLSEARPLWDLIDLEQGVIIDDIRGDTEAARVYRELVGASMETYTYVRSWMAVPMRMKDRRIGALFLAHSDTGAYNAHHAGLALAIAQQAAIAIENARLYQKAQEVAALEERQRLARELHDSVSQALFGIGLGARTARALLERDVAKAAQSIDYVLSLTQGGMAEMRALIFELRPESLEKEGLVPALKKQAAAVSARHEVPISPTLGDEPDVSLPVKEALYRIAQEALHNAVKHAGPRSVEVSLEQQDGEVALEIRDDGAGFDTGGSFPGHLGLHSMRERAQRVDGTLEIESRIGEGTRVRVRVPAHAR